MPSKWKPLAIALLAVLLTSCSTRDAGPMGPTTTAIITKTVTAVPKAPKPTHVKVVDCGRVFSLMPPATLNFNLHNLSRAQEQADEGKCWPGWMSTYAEAFHSSITDPNCDSAIGYMLRGIRSWRLEVIAHARNAFLAGACSVDFGYLFD
jgi:hypothetical protein